MIIVREITKWNFHGPVWISHCQARIRRAPSCDTFATILFTTIWWQNNAQKHVDDAIHVSILSLRIWYFNFYKRFLKTIIEISLFWMLFDFQPYILTRFKAVEILLCILNAVFYSSETMFLIRTLLEKFIKKSIPTLPFGFEFVFARSLSKL